MDKTLPSTSRHAAVVTGVQRRGRGGEVWERWAQIGGRLDWVSGGSRSRGLRAAQSSQTLQGDRSYRRRGHLTGPHLGLHVVSVAAGEKMQKKSRVSMKLKTLVRHTGNQCFLYGLLLHFLNEHTGGLLLLRLANDLVPTETLLT